jgi:hypothetical protein
MHRPFVQNVWRKAGKLTCEYKVIVYFEAGHWYGRGVEFMAQWAVDNLTYG